MATTGKTGLSGIMGGAGDVRGNLKRFASREVKMMDPHSLAKELHMAEESYLLLDCRPILAYNSCHITGGRGQSHTCCMQVLLVLHLRITFRAALKG